MKAVDIMNNLKLDEECYKRVRCIKCNKEVRVNFSLSNSLKKDYYCNECIGILLKEVEEKCENNERSYKKWNQNELEMLDTLEIQIKPFKNQNKERI